jgi:hypothetical protein
MTGLKMLAVSVLVLSATSALAQGTSRLTPLVVDGERYFKLEWQAADQNGRPRVHGSILNDYGFAARKVRLLIDSLDATGGVTAQTLSYVPGDLTPGARYYFEAPVPARAASYRVAVFQWEWIQAGGGDTIR